MSKSKYTPVEMDALMERMAMVKAMEYICRQLNNENHLMTWLETGVADEDIPYGMLEFVGPISKDPAYYYAEDSERFGELMGDFLKIMSRAYKNGGLYCGDVSSKEKPPKEKPFGLVKWYNADLANALEENGIPATEENVNILRTECENNHHFTEPMIEAGWNAIDNYIVYLDDCGDFKKEEVEYCEPDNCEPDNLEMGFNPYLGGYDYDC